MIKLETEKFGLGCLGEMTVDGTCALTHTQTNMYVSKIHPHFQEDVKETA